MKPPVLPQIRFAENLENDKAVDALAPLPQFDDPHDQGCAGDHGPDSPCDRQNGWWPLSKLLIDQMANELIQRAGENPEIQAQFESTPESPLTITDARITVSNQRDIRAIQLSVRLFNNSDQIIAAFGLFFTTAELKPYYAAAPMRIRIEPHSAYTHVKVQEDMSSYWIGNPDKLIIKVAGVEFENGIKWGNSLSGRLNPTRR
jgi:hypothetical protein